MRALILLIWIICFVDVSKRIRLTEKELSDFFEEHFSEDELIKNEITSAAISVIQDGEVIFQNGYGWENPYSKIPTTNKTVFGVASVSKTFLSILLLKALSEADEVDVVDLNQCIEKYLPESIVASNTIIGNYFSSNGQPRTKPKRCIKLKDIVTHTAGYDQNTYDLGENFKEMKYNLDTDIRNNMPPRIRNPGEIGCYSNYGIAMLGAAIGNSNLEKYSYEEYLKENIFNKLGITNHAFYGYDQAVKYNPHVCKLACREKKSNKFQECGGWDYQHFDFKPSAAVLSDSIGMQVFVKSLLSKNKNLLAHEAQWKTLFSNHFSLTPTFPSIGVIFYHVPSWGIDWIGHDGDLPPFASELRMHRDSNIGYVLLMSKKYNPSKRFNFRRNVLSDFTRRFLIEEDYCSKILGGILDEHNHCLKTFDLKKISIPPKIQSVKKFCGCFVSTRFPHTSWMKLPSLLKLFSLSDYRNQDGSFCVDSTVVGGREFLRIHDTLNPNKFSDFETGNKILLIKKSYFGDFYPNSTDIDFVLSRMVNSGDENIRLEIDVTQGSDFVFIFNDHHRKYWNTQVAFGSYEYLSTSPKWYIFTYYFAFAITLFLILCMFVFILILLYGTCGYCIFCSLLIEGYKFTRRKKQKQNILVEDGVYETFGIQRHDDSFQEQQVLISKEKKKIEGICRVNIVMVYCVFPIINITTSFCSAYCLLLHYCLIFFVAKEYYLHTGKKTGLVSFASILPLFSLTMVLLHLFSYCAACCYLCFGKNNHKLFGCCCCGVYIFFTAILVITCILYSILASEFNVFLHT